MVILKLLSEDEEVEALGDSDRNGFAEDDHVIEIEPKCEVSPLSHVLSRLIDDPIRSTAVSGEVSAVNSTGNEKYGSKRAAEDEGDLNVRKRNKKKNKTLSSTSDAGAFADDAVAAMVDNSGGNEEKKKGLGAIKRVFSEEDEIAVLEGVIEYRGRTGLEPNSDSGAFYNFIKDHLHVEISRRQVMEKIRTMRRKFRVSVGKGEDPLFTRPHDSRVFELSKEIWGKTEANEETPNDNGARVCRKRTKRRKSNNAAVADTVIKKPIILGLPSQSAFQENQQVVNMESETGEGVGGCEMAEEAKSTSDKHAEVTNVESKNGEGPDKGDAECEVTAEEPGDAEGEAAAEKPKETCMKFGKMANIELENVEGPAKGDVECEEVVEKPKTNPGVVNTGFDDVVDKGVDGKNTAGDDADEFWARYVFLKDAVDTIVSKGLFDNFPKGLFREKVRGFGADEGKLWDERWMALCLEEMELEVRKRDLVTKFSKVVLDAWKKKK